MGQSASSQNAGENTPNACIVIADPSRSPCQMHSKLQGSENTFAAYRDCLADRWLAIPLSHALEREGFAVGHQPLPIHRRAIDRSEVTQPASILGARRNLGEPDGF